MLESNCIVLTSSAPCKRDIRARAYFLEIGHPDRIYITFTCQWPRDVTLIMRVV